MHPHARDYLEDEAGEPAPVLPRGRFAARQVAAGFAAAAAVLLAVALVAAVLSSAGQVSP